MRLTTLLAFLLALLVADSARAVDEDEDLATMMRFAKATALEPSADALRRMRFAAEQKRRYPADWRKILSVSVPSAEELARYATPLDADIAFRRNVGKLLHERTGALKPYVFGGDASKDLSVVALVQADQLICSGTLIAPDRVLTAAHCLCAADHFEVRFGAFAFLGSPRKIAEADRLRPQGQGCPVDYKRGDIAILRLQSDAPLDIVPASVINDSRDWPQTNLQFEVVGYGLTEEGAAGQRRRAVVGVARSRCNPSADPLAEESNCVADQEMILGEVGGKVDTCNGDSGGPAFLPVLSRATSGTRRRIVGVTSRGLAGQSLTCGDGGIYVRVDGAVGEWIAKSSGPGVGGRP